MIPVAAILLGGALIALAIALGLISVPHAGVRRRVAGLTPVQEDPTPRAFVAKPAPLHAVSRLTPPGLMNRIERNMVLAGRPDGWTRDRVVLAKPVGAAVAVLLAIVLVGGGSPVMTLFAIGLIVLGYFLPDLLIYNQAVKRQALIQRDLPDIMDQIVISIEAGVGFEAALARAGEKNEGPLADEIIRLIQDIALGMSRRDAYLALADRTSVDGLKTFARAVVQAEEFGVSIASVVRTQASEMRIARRARAEARAQQVPVKILLPLIVCILPVLFIVVLGPPLTGALGG